jgi:PTH2 family peptidyl-tRNA hydrolase
MNKETKQVIVMRRKFPDGKGGTFQIRRGKEIAQACHGSLSFLTRRLVGNSGNYKLSLSKAEQEWIESGFTKICLYVDTEEELMEVYKNAKTNGLEVHLITDAGRTEFDGPTKTCLAIGPDYSEKIDKVTGNLKLL